MYNALLHSIIRQRPTMACRIPIHIDAIRYVRATTQTTTKNDPENPSIIPCFVSLVFACPEMFSCWVINYGQSASYQSRLLSLWASYYDNVPTYMEREQNSCKDLTHLHLPSGRYEPKHLDIIDVLPSAKILRLQGARSVSHLHSFSSTMLKSLENSMQALAIREQRLGTSETRRGMPQSLVEVAHLNRQGDG